MWPVRAVKAHIVKAPGDRGGFLFKQFDKFFSVEKIKTNIIDLYEHDSENSAKTSLQSGHLRCLQCRFERFKLVVDVSRLFERFVFPADHICSAFAAADALVIREKQQYI